MSSLFWWIRQIVLISVSVFFVYFGIRLLISSYELNDPFTFLMTFFASNFIILISGTLIIGFAYRMIRVYRQSKNSDTWLKIASLFKVVRRCPHKCSVIYARETVAGEKNMNVEHRTSNIECWMGKNEEAEELIKNFVTNIKTAEKNRNIHSTFDIGYLKIKLRSGATSSFDVQRWTFDVQRSFFKQPWPVNAYKY